MYGKSIAIQTWTGYRPLVTMKLTLILLLAGVLRLSAGDAFAQQISLRKTDVPVAEVLQAIREQSGYNILYSPDVLKPDDRMSIHLNNATVAEAMERVLAGKGLAFRLIDRNIIITAGYPRPVQQAVRGTISDTQGVPLSGVTVRNKTGTASTVSDERGQFRLEVSGPGAVLVFTSIGFQTQELAVGTQTELRVVMEEEVSGLDEVVVTALGIQRKTRELTYAVQEVKGEEITRVKDANFVNSLTGKLAGVTINSSAAGIGGATRVVMRGTKSINQGNNVLYVVDGMPMPNISGGNVAGPFQSVVSGEGISSLNPEDIESISALTGPSATALYGNQGAAGVLVVTTKKGVAGKMRINLSHSTDFFNPFVMPRFQQTYGQADPDKYESWGARLETPATYSPRDFFQTGYNAFNSVSFSGGTEKSQTHFSLGSNNAEGIIRNNMFNRYNFYLRHTAELTDRLTADFNAMYVLMDDRNMIAQGQYHNPLVPIYLFPPAADIRKYQVYERYDPDRKIPVQFWPYGNLGLGVQNPYWNTDAESTVNDQKRYMLSTTAKYRVFDWLDVTGRVRIDNTNIHSETKRPAGTDQNFASEFGYYRTGRTEVRSTYADLIASIRKPLSSVLNLAANIGGSIEDNRLDSLQVFGNLTKVANVYNTVDNMDPVSGQGYVRTQLQSAFATAQLEYDRWLFLDATGRYEWPSQLPPGFAAQTSYFYPSVGVSAILSDVLPMGKALTFLKLRASYAEVGNPPRFGLTNPVFPQNNASFRPAPFKDFQPERTRSFETGAELKFFNNRLGVNATLYKSNTTNQLLETPVSGSIYSVFYYNAGDVENKGIEAGINYDLVRNGFTWNSGAVFSLNRNRIKRLSEGTVHPLTGEIFGADTLHKSAIGSLANLLVIGGTMSDLYVSQALRQDNQGLLWINPHSGEIQPIQTPNRLIGTTLPDYTIGWRNSLSYKNVSLSFLVDARVGGVGISATQSIMDAFGVSQQSADARDAGGVEILGKVYPDVQQFYNIVGAASGGSVGLMEHYVYDATNVRLREAAIGYTLPGTLLGGKVRDISLSVIGRNLLMFYNKAPFDPESTASTGTYFQGIDYFRQPSYRSFGFSLRAQF